MHSQPELNTCLEQVIHCQNVLALLPNQIPSAYWSVSVQLVTVHLLSRYLLISQIMNLSVYDRRQQERYDKSHHRLRQVERDLRRSEREEKRLEEKARENDLQERDRLKQRLDKVNQQNILADEKIAVSLCLLCLLWNVYCTYQLIEGNCISIEEFICQSQVPDSNVSC